MKEKGKATTGGDRVLRVVAVLVLWIAPLPAAFFVGRSVYWHLIYSWHLDLAWLGVAAALITGGMIELVGILSAHVALACARWNQRGDVQREKGAKETAPLLLAVACFVVYAAVAVCLAVVLEALPWLAVYAPALITVMAADAYVSLGLYEQHRDRLARYSLEWNWTVTSKEIIDNPMVPQPPVVVQVAPAMASATVQMVSAPTASPQLAPRLAPENELDAEPEITVTPGFQVTPGMASGKLVDVAAEIIRLHPDWIDAKVMAEVPCSASTVRRAREKE